jgi:hypothetical protein
MQTQTLGEYSFKKRSFKKTQDILKSAPFEHLNSYDRQLKINQILLSLIQESASGFLLVEIADFIEEVHKLNLLDKYNLTSFELWLNQFSGLSEEENRKVRGKIVGKTIARSEYEGIFPISMGKVYEGSHFVTAHGSPDLDTIVASFWGFVDAFGAKVSKGLHVWNIPGGAPNSLVELDHLFYKIFGNFVFKAFSRSRTILSLSSFDLMTQKGLVRKGREDLMFEYTEDRSHSAVVIVDDKGRYVGDWRSIDIEAVRSIVNIFNAHLRFLEYRFQINLISLFAKSKVSRVEIEKVIADIYEYQFKTFDPAKDLTRQQSHHLTEYMQKVLHIEKGQEASFDDFIKAMEKQGVAHFEDFHAALRAFYEKDMFDREGLLIEPRPTLFLKLEKVVELLSIAIRKVRSYVDSLGVAFRIKKDVLGHGPNFLPYRSDLEEIRTKIEPYPYLTVNYACQTGDMLPLGVIYASDLQKSKLGTVSLRDFSNHNETGIPSYLEVISAIDHHKTSLKNGAPSRMIISDVQSVNSLVAKLAFDLNDRHSFGALTSEKIESQLKELHKQSSKKSLRLQQRLLMRKINRMKAQESPIAKEREMMEYFHFVYAILDDTDLLTKVSRQDLECMAELINRLKSLQMEEEVEVIDFDDIDKNDPAFDKKAALKLLQNSELFSIYNKSAEEKEKYIASQLKSYIKGSSSIFEDTKVQNGCARVGQKKIFAKNYPQLRERAGDILKAWVAEAEEFALDNSMIDLHMLMISTIASAAEVRSGKPLAYDHLDELWIYIPMTEMSISHLKLFLSAFSMCPSLVKEGLKVEFLGKNGKELSLIFKESFIPAEFIFNEYDIPVAIIHYRAGSINSRKSQISPYLPEVRSTN